MYMKYKLLFLHGISYSGQCDMARALQDCLTDNLRSYDDMYAKDEVEVLCPDLPPNPYAALDIIRGLVEREGIDVIVGNSCGAMYAHIIAAENELPCLVSNPYYKMPEFLKDRKGVRRYKSEREDGNETFVVDEALVEEFVKLEKEDKVFMNAEKCKQFVWGIFDEDDELDVKTEKDGRVINKHEKLFLDHYSLSFHFSGKHTPTYEETKKYHVPLASRLIMEFAYYKKKQREGETLDDKKYRLGVQYTHEFSQFYIDKMKELYGAKGFYRCDIEDDFSHIIYRYRPEGKDKPFVKDGVMYDFLIEYHRGKPSEGIYYGCKAEIIPNNNYDSKADERDMESHAEELRELWPNIFLKGYEKCNSLQRELTEILNNTFQWKNFFKCYKPTDNIREQRYWLFWVTLCDDEDINDVGAVATKLMQQTFMRFFDGNTSEKLSLSTDQGTPSKDIEKRSLHLQKSCFTNAAYQRLLDKMISDISERREDKSYVATYFHDADSVMELFDSLEGDGILKKDDRYEKGWMIPASSGIRSRKRFVEIIKEWLKEKKEEKYNRQYKIDDIKYPEEFDSLVIIEGKSPMNKH